MLTTLKKHKWKLLFGAGLGALTAGLAMGCCTFSAPPYEGPESDHFDGERFRNVPERKRQESGGFLRWQLTKEQGEWPDWVDSEPGPAPAERVENGELRVTWVNHATTLIQMDGLNILTDPIWSERTSPVSWVGPTRKRAPGLRFEDLPPIDVVVISHNHYDHTDIPTLKRLDKEHSPRFVVPLGNSRLLRDNGITNTGDLDWWQRVPASDEVRVTLVPAQHFSGRGLCDRGQTLWGGYVFEGPAGPVYFAGDTGWGPHFEQINAQFGAPRLAILPIGAFRPRWFMSPVHISPAEAVQAHRVLEAETSMGMHWGTFRLADDGYAEPVEALEEALADQDVDPERFWVLDEGHGRNVP
ncbi:MAG: MBL fold metallo-hydrolase [Persicimonas sp.]